MDKLFSQDNPFWQAMGTIFDLFVLNVLWLLCCIPIFTIGPSTCAFFYVTSHLIHNEEGSLSKEFFRSFRQNFKQGIQLGLPLTFIGIFLCGDIYLCYKAGTGIYTFFLVFFAVVFLCWAFIVLYIFPILAKYEKRNLEILALAFSLSIRHIGHTLLMLLAAVLALWACHLLPGLALIAFGLAGGAQAALFDSIMKKYFTETETEIGDILE
jgi:uncharacterized membrane protein YesL